MNTTRRTNIMQNVGKTITLYSNGSDCTESSEKENKTSRHFKRSGDLRTATLSTKYTDVTTNRKPVDVEMQFEAETGFSLDSSMSHDDQNVHSKVVSEYSRDIINNMKRSEFTMVGNLDKHEIKSSHRRQMVIWIEEVLRIFKCPVDTFFLAVNIMDRYLETSKTPLALSELHEIGIVSMFIASKYQEVESLTLDLMINKVAHGKITEKAILSREKKILCALKFKLSKPNALSFIESYIEHFSEKFSSEDDKKAVNELTLKIAKNGMSDRRLAFNVLPSELALCSLIIALKEHSKSVRKAILDTEFSKAIKNELTSDEGLVLQFGKRLRKLALEKVY